jgi:hypothetical protein
VLSHPSFHSQIDPEISVTDPFWKFQLDHLSIFSMLKTQPQKCGGRVRHVLGMAFDQRITVVIVIHPTVFIWLGSSMRLLAHNIPVVRSTEALLG